MDSTVNLSHQHLLQIKAPTHNNPTLIEEPRVAIDKPTIMGKILVIIFYMQLFLVTLLAVVLIIRGFIDPRAHHRDFNPLDWYPPMLTAVGMSGCAGFMFLILAQCYSSKAIIQIFPFGPMATDVMGVLLAWFGSPLGLCCGVLTTWVGLIQSLYGFWALPRFNLVAVSTASPPPRSILMTTFVIVFSIGYCTLLIGGIGQATAAATRIDHVLIAVILLSMGWTMQVIRNVLQVAGSRVRHAHFTCGAKVDSYTALKDTLRHSMGAVCFGSILVPVVGLVRGSARAVKFIADSDSCLAFASRLVTSGNHWGFVHVGVYGKGIMLASADTWEMFRTATMEQLIENDLTGSICFFCGVAGGTLCALAAGTWTIVVHREYPTDICVYAFLIGYFISRISMAWPQACVSAYHVAFAEKLQSAHFDATIPILMEQLRRNQP